MRSHADTSRLHRARAEACAAAGVHRKAAAHARKAHWHAGFGEESSLALERLGARRGEEDRIIVETARQFAALAALPPDEKLKALRPVSDMHQSYLTGDRAPHFVVSVPAPVPKEAERTVRLHASLVPYRDSIHYEKRRALGRTLGYTAEMVREFRPRQPLLYYDEGAKGTRTVQYGVLYRTPQKYKSSVVPWSLYTSDDAHSAAWGVIAAAAHKVKADFIYCGPTFHATKGGVLERVKGEVNNVAEANAAGQARVKRLRPDVKFVDSIRAQKAETFEKGTLLNVNIRPGEYGMSLDTWAGLLGDRFALASNWVTPPP
jgi:hypothetical protein